MVKRRRKIAKKRRKVRRRGHRRKTKTADVWVSEHLLTVGTLGAKAVAKGGERLAVFTGKKAKGYLARRKRKKFKLGVRKYKGVGTTIKKKPYPHTGKTLI